MKEKIENNSNKAIEELKEFINNNEVQNISVFTAKKILLELETYKKIAEMFGKSLISISGEKTSLEELIDWARKEVDKQ